MAFWHESNFLSNFKNHIVKWYRLVILPVFHIDNSGSKQRFHTEGEEPENSINSGASGAYGTAGNNLGNSESFTDMTSEQASSGNTASGGSSFGASVTMPAQNKKSPVASGDAEAVLNRINSDREGRHLDEIEKARRKAEEDARLASIMNANKVDVDSFIEQGRTAAKNAEADAKAEEEMRRAQEIIDRLNREAAEDEAKKQAELDAAKASAAEKFGS